MSDELTLTARFELGPYFLLLGYEVENRGSRDAYLLNRLYRQTPRWNLDHNLIYIHLLAERSTIWLAKKIAAVPTDRSVLSPVAPFVTPLRGRSKFTEEVYIPLPVREYREYAPSLRAEADAPATAAPQRRVYNSIYFSLEYYWAAPGVQEKTLKIGAQKALYTWAPPGVQLEFGLLSSPLQSIRLVAEGVA